MKINEAISALGALAQDTRMRVFRLLVRHGNTGLPAGRIAEELGVNATTLSRHLAQMESAGLVGSERQMRSIIYRVDFEAARALMSFLMEDCCASDPRITGKARSEAAGPSCCDT